MHQLKSQSASEYIQVLTQSWVCRSCSRSANIYWRPTPFQAQCHVDTASVLFMANPLIMIIIWARRCLRVNLSSGFSQCQHPDDIHPRSLTLLPSTQTHRLVTCVGRVPPLIHPCLLSPRNPVPPKTVWNCKQEKPGINYEGEFSNCSMLKNNIIY